jgi:hypothetical protein
LWLERAANIQLKHIGQIRLEYIQLYVICLHPASLLGLVKGGAIFVRIVVETLGRILECNPGDQGPYRCLPVFDLKRLAVVLVYE